MPWWGALLVAVSGLLFVQTLRLRRQIEALTILVADGQNRDRREAEQLAAKLS